jgi:hypothetical protein
LDIFDEGRCTQNDLKKTLDDSEEEEELAKGRMGDLCAL